MLSYKVTKLGSYLLPKNLIHQSVLSRYRQKAIPWLLLPALSFTAMAPYAEDNPIRLPELGTVASSSLTIEKELRIGQAYRMMMRSQLPIITDPLIDQYINDIGLSLVANANDVKTPFEFFVVENKVINAFAFFGGHVGIHSGLILLADNESELAAVLGHEITHITQRHLARSIEARSKTSPATLATLIGSIALVLAGAGEAGIAGIQASLAVSQQLAINYTRKNEREADRIGIELTARSDFNPRSAADFFTKMASQYRYSTKLPPMLLSHPVTELRIAEARVRAEKYPNIIHPVKLSFLLTKARIMVRFNDSSNDTIRHTLNVAFDNPEINHQKALSYGKALLALKEKNYEQAQLLLEPLISNNQNNLYYIDTQTDILLAQDNVKEAISMLSKYNSLMKNNPVVTLNYASALIKDKQYDTAIQSLNRFLEYNPNNAPAWSMLLNANRLANHPVERHVAKAEQYALYGNFKGALKELYKAHNRIDNDAIAKAKVQSRIKQIRVIEENLKKLKI